MRKLKKIILSVISLFSFAILQDMACFASTQQEESNTPKIQRHFVAETVPLNLEEIVNSSDRIFVGTCLDAEEIENDLESNLPVIKYIFKVNESIKGIGNKTEIIFKQWKGGIKDIAYEKDKKYVLFLYPDSERGLTSPVGLLQGHFDIHTIGFFRKKEMVRNKVSNRGLSKNLRTQKIVTIQNNKYLNNYLHHCSEFGKPIRYKEFIEAVRYLVKKGN